MNTDFFTNMAISRKNLSHILFFIIFFILFILLLFVGGNKQEGFQEGIDIPWPKINWPKIPSVDEIFKPVKDFFENIMATVKQEVFDKIVGAFNTVKDAIEKPFKDLETRFKTIGYGFDNIFKGIDDEFKGVGTGLKRGFDDIGSLIEYTGEFVLTYTVCGVKYITNFKQCFWYYLLDLIGKSIYLPIRFCMYIVSITAYSDIYKIETKIWSLITKADQRLYNNFGYKLTKWPKDVRELCYNCKRLKVRVLKDKAQEVDDDFNIHMREDLEKGIIGINKGGEQLSKAFTKSINELNALNRVPTADEIAAAALEKQKKSDAVIAANKLQIEKDRAAALALEKQNAMVASSKARVAAAKLRKKLKSLF